MNVSMIGKLSTEELNRWRVISANKELVDLGHPGISPVEARGYIMDFYRFIGEVVEGHGILPAMGFEVAISDGSIVVIVDE
jgi:hypothetical protein